jgi:hypothetical protein
MGSQSAALGGAGGPDVVLRRKNMNFHHANTGDKAYRAGYPEPVLVYRLPVVALHRTFPLRGRGVLLRRPHTGWPPSSAGR